MNGQEEVRRLFKVIARSSSYVEVHKTLLQNAHTLQINILFCLLWILFLKKSLNETIFRVLLEIFFVYLAPELVWKLPLLLLSTQTHLLLLSLSEKYKFK